MFDEDFIKLACRRRKLSRPLPEQGKENAKERVPSYRILVAAMSAHLKTCKVKKCHAFLKLPVGQLLSSQLLPLGLILLFPGDGEVKPFLTPEMTSRPDVKLAMHKLLNNLQMVYYHDWTEASIYFEKEDFLQLKKSPARDQEDKDADDLPQVRLIDHLPLAAFQCSSPALTTFEYADEYAGFGWPIKNSEGVTLLDCVQSLTMG